MCSERAVDFCSLRDDAAVIKCALFTLHAEQRAFNKACLKMAAVIRW